MGQNMENSPLTESQSQEVQLSPLQKAEKKYQDALSQLTDRLDVRKGRLFDPELMGLAAGFLGPTETGSFGEALGRAAKGYSEAARAGEKQDIDLAKMRMELAKSGIDIEREKAVQEAIPSLYTQTSTGLEFNPEAAKKLAVATRDPKIMQMIYEQDKTRRLREAGQSVFTPITDDQGKTTYKFNPDSVFMLAKASDNPLETIAKYADMVPKLRKAGMIKDLSGDITTPFDAIVLMADSLGKTGPAYKDQAMRLAKQYQTGMIDEDKANSLAQQMMTAINSSVDRQTAQENNRIMQGFQRQLAQQNFDLNQQKLQDKREENEKKLSDEQKITFNKIVTPIINEGIKGNSALMQVQALRDVIESAPSGTISGAYAASVGRLFGTDDRTAQLKLEGLSKGLIPLIPRLPGSASNLDSNNLEKSLMKLESINLTNDQRRELVNEIYEGFKRLTDRADRVQSFWDANKKFDPKILNPDQPKPAPSSATPSPVTPPSSGVNLRWNPATKQFE